jgi:hypothetical protein
MSLRTGRRARAPAASRYLTAVGAAGRRSIDTAPSAMLPAAHRRLTHLLLTGGASRERAPRRRPGGLKTLVLPPRETRLQVRRLPAPASVHRRLSPQIHRDLICGVTDAVTPSVEESLQPARALDGQQRSLNVSKPGRSPALQ